MTILENIYNQRLENKPLFIEDFIDISNNYDSIKTQLCNYVKAGLLKRYSNGIYYLPTKTVLGESKLSFNDVIEKKYIFNNNKFFGYYTGLTLLNMVGITTQVPNIPEITTNNEATRKRKIKIANRYVIIRKSRIIINSDNVLYLQFLDIFKYAKEFTINNNLEKIITFFIQNNLSFKKLQTIEKSTTMKIRKLIRSTGVYDEIALGSKDI